MRGTSPMAEITVAQVMAVPTKGDLAANHDRLMTLLTAVETEVDVVVTPECFLDGYVSTEDDVSRETIANFAIDPGSSPYVREAADWAAHSKSWLIYGCTRFSGTNAVRNTALVLNRDGNLVGTYDKAHCQTHDMKYTAGDSLPVFDGDFGPFGVMICADRRWPETVRTLALGGARVIFNPTYGMHDARNLRMMQTRSYESEVFIVFTHPLQSLITDPTGEIAQNEDADEAGITITRLDLARVDRVRSGPSAHLRDRRPELYR